MAAFITAADLGIDTNTDQGLFDWLLASMLFGRPIPQEAAASAFRRFKEDGWDAPDRFAADDHHAIWHELWEGDYHRMSSVMSEELRDGMRALIADYDGSVARRCAPPARARKSASDCSVSRGSAPRPPKSSFAKSRTRSSAPPESPDLDQAGGVGEFAEPGDLDSAPCSQVPRLHADLRLGLCGAAASARVPPQLTWRLIAVPPP